MGDGPPEAGVTCALGRTGPPRLSAGRPGRVNANSGTTPGRRRRSPPVR
ncbi:hypothetical protein RAJCM14343_0503 [Rhodococcus aetherivorans]|uniref:Uncharacterized protein n=1 Tax=Rhodococcus aetherivorans TaxID=191292 RepID=A0ABQ0YFE2_9NOCA|nr:hypothetical protein RAJCM14343_0503 [Rhodococcus aetherivorans]